MVAGDENFVVHDLERDFGDRFSGREAAAFPNDSLNLRIEVGSLEMSDGFGFG